MTTKIRVGLLGLGGVGEAFAEHFLERIQERGMPVEIVAVAHRHLDSPIALGFSQNGVPVFRDAREILRLGEKIDIIFDLTGDPVIAQEMRLRLIETKNRHTHIAPEIVAQLLWHFFDEVTEDMKKTA